MTWAAEHLTRARALRDTGAPYSHIAATLNKEFGLELTKNSVQGALSRRALPATDRLSGWAEHLATNRVKQLTKPYAGPPLPIEHRLFDSTTRRVMLMDLERGDCKYVVNEGGPYRFCGRPADGSYCAHHKTRVYRPAGARP